MRIIKYTLLLCSIVCLNNVHAAATDNLWLCPDPSGVDNVISATSQPTANCKPYSSKQLKKKAAITTPQHQPTIRNQTTPTTAIVHPQDAEPSTPSLNLAAIDYAPMNSKPSHWQRGIRDEQNDQDNSNHGPLSTEPNYRPNATKIYLCTIDGKKRIIEGKQKPAGEECLLMGAKGANAAALAAPITEKTDTHTTNTPNKTSANTTDTASTQANKIYLCRGADGSETITQGNNPPSANCKLMGVTGEKSNDTAITPPNSNTADKKTAKAPPEAESSIVATESDPGDIYKCYDSSGRPSFVNEKEIEGYRRCQFFSRSFASVKKSLQAPAAQSVPEVANVTGPRLLCSGAGKVVYNGEERQFECATRSYDHSIGSTGGEIRSGEQYARIEAHDMDYFATSGNCGGTITSENGRVLHLEPTKDCPAAFKLEAQRIAYNVRAGLNINVSGAFLARQKALSPQINRIAREVGIDPYLVHAVISAESAYKTHARSHAGAQGLMQLMPATARRFGVSDPYHTGQNIRGGTTYLKWLLNKFNGNMELAIAGYNAGEGNVIKYGYKIPPFIETRAYVPKVMQYYRRYRNKPELIGL